MKPTDRIRAALKMEKPSRPVVRKQNNFLCNSDISRRLKVLALVLGVPNYILLEHLVEIGSDYISKVMQEPDRLSGLIQHLRQEHWIGRKRE